MKISAAVLVVSLIGINPAWVMASPIAQWTFETSVQTPASAGPNITASSFTMSSGTASFVGGNAPTASTAISGIGWDVSDGGKWWDFTVTANAGYLLDLTSLTFDDRASGTGAAHWSVTINGVVAASGQSTHTAFSTDPMNAVDLNTLAFQDMTSADVRIFGYGATGPGGTWRLDNVNLNGAVAQISSVPDSSPSLAGLGCAVGLLAVLRRMRICSSPLAQMLG
jgi:hypothetical protein